LGWAVVIFSLASGRVLPFPFIRDPRIVVFWHWSPPDPRNEPRFRGCLDLVPRLHFDLRQIDLFFRDYGQPSPAYHQRACAAHPLFLGKGHPRPEIYLPFLPCELLLIFFDVKYSLDEVPNQASSLPLNPPPPLQGRSPLIPEEISRPPRFTSPLFPLDVRSTGPLLSLVSSGETIFSNDKPVLFLVFRLSSSIFRRCRSC